MLLTEIKKFWKGDETETTSRITTVSVVDPVFRLIRVVTDTSGSTSLNNHEGPSLPAGGPRVTYPVFPDRRSDRDVTTGPCNEKTKTWRCDIFPRNLLLVFLRQVEIPGLLSRLPDVLLIPDSKSEM